MQTSAQTPIQAPANAIRVPAAVALRGMPSAGAGLLQVLDKGEELFAEGDAADWFYKVVSGAIRTSTLLSDGRRQIGAFHLAGEIFGLEAGAVRRFTAEALGAATVVAFRRSRLAPATRGDATSSDSALCGEVLASIVRSLDRAREHMLLLGRKTAPERVAAFLLDMADRIAADDRRCNLPRFELPMTRSDIADYLGLTIETVSRTLSQFVRDGLIRMPAASRCVELSDRQGLQRLGA